MSKRLQDLATPLTQTRRKIEKYAARPFEKMSDKQKFWLGFAALCLLTTLFVSNPFWHTTAELYKEGDIARESIISPADISVTDAEETTRVKESARESVQPIFIFESKRSDEAVQSFRSAWENLTRKKESGDANVNVKINGNARADASEAWTGAGGAAVGKVFAARKFSQNELDAVTRVLRENADGSIFGDQDKQYFQSEIILNDRQKPNQQSVVKMPESSMTSLSEARVSLREGLQKIRSLSDKEVEAFYAALAPLIQPSVVFDGAATENARQSIEKSVPSVTVSLKRGQMITREGDTVTPNVLSQIAAIRSYSNSTRRPNRFFGLLILISALFWVAWKFIEQHGNMSRIILSEERTFALFGFIVLTQTLLMATFFRLAEFTAAQNVKAPLNDPSLWAFAIPFAFGSLLMTLLADRRTALFTGFFLALIAGLLAPKSLEFALYAAITSAVAVYGIGRYRSRASVTTAGVLVGLASAAVTIALIGYTQQPFILNTVALAVCCGLASGLVTAAVTAVFLPLCETFFGILTDVKLLELSNADLPALGQLALRAPGTNQHSHAVGQLAEEACRVVGANGLLARIGALYHDIGKTAAPEHFIENQHGRNPHDRLKPAQSAKILVSHVTYGMKLGREMGLPQRIIDFIPQHHGTRTLHYFLKKAQAEARDDEKISENDFRYPGPKPQFKESAIMMIADSCEAAARSLESPTPENIRYIVAKIIDAIVVDDQLDECDLTLRELTQIREAMIKSLVSIYHSRVDYPGYVPPNSIKTLIADAETNSENRAMLYADPADIPISKGGEVEDEAIDRSLPPEKAGVHTVR
ncbi:MAG: HDIG domain-containing protein [Acidobacteriota bacterium]|nr:HDIG domain-containing protein [Acidobacteriota bacterium]